MDFEIEDQEANIPPRRRRKSTYGTFLGLGRGRTYSLHTHLTYAFPVAIRVRLVISPTPFHRFI